MTDDNDHRTAAGREQALDDHNRRIAALESWKTVEEFKEKGREKRVNLAITSAITLAVAITSGIIVALAAGGHL